MWQKHWTTYNVNWRLWCHSYWNVLQANCSLCQYISRNWCIKNFLKRSYGWSWIDVRSSGEWTITCLDMGNLSNSYDLGRRLQVSGFVMRIDLKTWPDLIIWLDFDIARLGNIARLEKSGRWCTPPSFASGRPPSGEDKKCLHRFIILSLYPYLPHPSSFSPLIPPKSP